MFRIKVCGKEICFADTEKELVETVVIKLFERVDLQAVSISRPTLQVSGNEKFDLIPSQLHNQLMRQVREHNWNESMNIRFRRVEWFYHPYKKIMVPISSMSKCTIICGPNSNT